MADRVGQQLDNYRLTRLLGAGGFGEVYLAEHLYHTTQVAIKILPQLAQDDLHSFLIEARTFRLRHPNIVQVLDFGVEGRIPFIVMEYAPNGTLRQRYPKGTRVPLPTIVSYVNQVASALQYAHEDRLVHRDVKPENMLIGAKNQVLLSDFGIATIAHATSSQSVEAMAGTIPYMAPEQIQGHPRPASDQYSLGVVVYAWLCGDYPFHGTLTEVAVQHAAVPPPPLREKVPTISPDVERVVTTALEQASQVKQPEPEHEPVVPVSETTGTHQSQQPTEMATPVPVIPFSQQLIVDEVSADTPDQPHTFLPLSGKERLRQAEEERVRKAKDTVLTATELAASTHQTPLPTEVAHSSKPSALRPDAMVAVKSAKPGTSRRLVMLVLAGLVIVALASGIAWITAHPAFLVSYTTTTAIVSRAYYVPYGITAGPDGNLWFTEYDGNKIGIGRISPSGTITEFPGPTLSSPDGITAGPDGNLWFTENSFNQIGRITSGK